VAHTIGQLVEQYGYLMVALIVCAENLGLPLPGETALIAAAAYAARGQLSLPWVVASAAVGTIAGGSAGYWIGRVGGLPFVRRVGRYVGIGQEQIDRGHEFFAKNGAKTVFLARFVAILRIVAGILAGVTRMRFSTFTIYNALGGLVWSVGIGALGYAFGYDLPRLHRILGRGGLIALAATIVVFVVLIRVRRRRAI
jgi:membrane protein DedA with SNARE-associated domain